VTFRHDLFPAYKANRRGSIARQHAARAARVERRKIEAPDPELDFFATLPDELTMGLREGPTGITCVSVEIIGRSCHVRAKGCGHDWLLGQVAQFLRKIAPKGFHQPRPITGIMKCPPHPGRTASGPMVPGYERALSIEIVSGDPVIVVTDAGMTSRRPLIFAGRRG